MAKIEREKIKGTTDKTTACNQKGWAKNLAQIIILSMLLVMCFAVTVMAAENQPEVITSINRLGQLFVLLVRSFGAILALWGIIQLGQSFPAHDSSQRNIGLLCAVGGLIILFGPEILEFIAPGSMAGMK